MLFGGRAAQAWVFLALGFPSIWRRFSFWDPISIFGSPRPAGRTLIAVVHMRRAVGIGSAGDLVGSRLDMSFFGVGLIAWCCPDRGWMGARGDHDGVVVWCGGEGERCGPGIFQVDMSWMSSPEIFPASFPPLQTRGPSLLALRAPSRDLVMGGLVQRCSSGRVRECLVSAQRSGCTQGSGHAGIAERSPRFQGPFLCASIRGPSSTTSPRLVHIVKSSPRYWPTGLLCAGSWGKCIASLALNAPQRRLWWWW